MKEIRGSASAAVPAPANECFSLLAAVDRYAVWNGDLVRELNVLERDPEGLPARVRAVISIKRGSPVKTFELTVAVTTDPPHAVYITRIPNEPSDREELHLVWRVDPQRSAADTRIELQFAAMASFVPGFLPLGGIGNRIAEKLVESAGRALRAA